jgi:hypothetical protein
MRSKTSLCALALAALLAIGFGQPATAGASPKTCVPKGAKTTWNKYGVRVYGSSKIYACSNKYGKHLRLEVAEFESESFSKFHTNGRYLFYVREFVGPTQSYGSIGRLLDLKTGKSTKKLGTNDLDYQSVPECAPVEILCGRSAWGGAIGPGHSFVIGYWMTFNKPDGTRVGEQFWIERHCFNASLTHRTVELLDKVSSLTDLISLKSDRGTRATWSNNGAPKSAPFC